MIVFNVFLLYVFVIITGYYYWARHRHVGDIAKLKTHFKKLLLEFMTKTIAFQQNECILIVPSLKGRQCTVC